MRLNENVIREMTCDGLMTFIKKKFDVSAKAKTIGNWLCV